MNKDGCKEFEEKRYGIYNDNCDFSRLFVIQLVFKKYFLEKEYG